MWNAWPHQEDFRTQGAFAVDCDSPLKPSASFSRGSGSGKPPYRGNFFFFFSTALALKSRRPNSNGASKRKSETIN